MQVRRAVLFIAIFFCTTGFDQASKHWAETSLPPGTAQPFIEGYWDWEIAKNTGVAFSTFAGVDGAQIVLSILAACALIAARLLEHPHHAEHGDDAHDRQEDPSHRLVRAEQAERRAGVHR